MNNISNIKIGEKSPIFIKYNKDSIIKFINNSINN